MVNFYGNKKNKSLLLFPTIYLNQLLLLYLKNIKTHKIFFLPLFHYQVEGGSNRFLHTPLYVLFGTQRLVVQRCFPTSSNAKYSYFQLTIRQATSFEQLPLSSVATYQFTKEKTNTYSIPPSVNGG